MEIRDQDVGALLARITTQLESLERRATEAEGMLRTLHNEIYSQSTQAPGLWQRVDRNERRIAQFVGFLTWGFGGGALGILGGLILLAKILAALQSVS